MRLLFLEPTEKERSGMFRKICSSRLLAECVLQEVTIHELTEQYIARFGEYQRRVICSDINTLCGLINLVADDAIDRLTPEAVEAVVNRHILWTPQTEILIKHVAGIASRRLELSMIHEDVIAGVNRLYGAAAKQIRVIQDA